MPLIDELKRNASLPTSPLRRTFIPLTITLSIKAPLNWFGSHYKSLRIKGKEAENLFDCRIMVFQLLGLLKVDGCWTGICSTKWRLAWGGGCCASHDEWDCWVLGDDSLPCEVQGLERDDENVMNLCERWSSELDWMQAGYQPSGLWIRLLETAAGVGVHLHVSGMIQGYCWR